MSDDTPCVSRSPEKKVKNDHGTTKRNQTKSDESSRDLCGHFRAGRLVPGEGCLWTEGFHGRTDAGLRSQGPGDAWSVQILLRFCKTRDAGPDVLAQGQCR